MPGTTHHDSTRRLVLSIEVSDHAWHLTAGERLGGRTATRVVKPVIGHVLEAVRRFRDALGIPDDAPVHACYEAGREGFWLFRALAKAGIRVLVVHPKTAQPEHGGRRAKTDRLDGDRLLGALVRHLDGDRHAVRVVRVPSEAEEDARELLRLRDDLKRHATQVDVRAQSLARKAGAIGWSPGRDVDPKELRDWDGRPLRPHLLQRIEQAVAELRQARKDVLAVEAQLRARTRRGTDRGAEIERKLQKLYGLGMVNAPILSRECFAWREIRNVRELGQLAGLAPTPFDSGKSKHEQGVSKAGNRLVRWIMVETARLWLRYQPESELSRWYRRRFEYEGKRAKRVGLVALARKLLIALWKWVKDDELPAGARLKPA